MRRKEFLFIGLVLLFSIIFTGTTFAAQEYHWKIGHIRPPGTEIDNDTNWFVNKVKEETSSRIAIGIYPVSQLGDYAVVQERVSIGAVEMQVACIGTTVSKELQINTAPYLATNWAEAEYLYGPEGIIF
jgi:TRAP-type C4-dicarboxylate transport system substrate-binding protein